MSLTIVFTPKGKETFLLTLQFIKENWGLSAANDFLKRSFKVFNTVSLQPYILKTYLDFEVRKGFITKQTSFIYRVTSNQIEILFFGIIGKNQLLSNAITIIIKLSYHNWCTSALTNRS
jgi:plasmid stabilization system protein ParE